MSGAGGREPLTGVVTVDGVLSGTGTRNRRTWGRTDLVTADNVRDGCLKREIKPLIHTRIQKKSVRKRVLFFGKQIKLSQKGFVGKVGHRTNATRRVITLNLSANHE